MRRTLAAGALLAGRLLLAPWTCVGQEPRYLAGVVIDEITGQPLPRAVISLPLMGIRVETGENGGFLVEGVQAGPIDVRFEAPGYMTVVERLELSALEFVQVGLTPIQAVLDTLQVIGGRLPTRSGSDLGAQTDTEPWRSVLDLLEEQVPGVVVQREGGNLGTGAAIHFRGSSSFQESSAPDIYLDGVRLDGRTGGRSVHVLDLISADVVQRVQVFKGASAGARFGAGAANGAIVIETRRGVERDREP